MMSGTTRLYIVLRRINHSDRLLNIHSRIPSLYRYIVGAATFLRSGITINHSAGSIELKSRSDLERISDIEVITATGVYRMIL